MAVPLVPLFLGGIGVFSAVRALWQPHRAVVRHGFVSRCAGPMQGGGCAPYVLLGTGPGDDAFYAAGKGIVTSVGPFWVHVALKREPVVLSYTGSPNTKDWAFLVDVHEGDVVGTGEQLGKANPVAFSVYKMVRAASGAISYQPLEPASWLASRGFRLSHEALPNTDDWCERGRTVKVPANVAACGLKLPEPSDFALLPVSISQE